MKLPYTKPACRPLRGTEVRGLPLKLRMICYRWEYLAGSRIHHSSFLRSMMAPEVQCLSAPTPPCPTEDQQWSEVLEESLPGFSRWRR